MSAYVRKEELAEGIDDRWVTIYALREPVTRWTSGDIRYVGKTIGFVWHRVRAHAYEAKRGSKLPVSLWVRKTVVEGGMPFHIKHLEHVPPGRDWAEREMFWIAKCRAEFPDLLNVTDGGEGLSGHGFSFAHRHRISTALRTGSECQCEVCGKSFWRKRNQVLKGQNRFCSMACYQSWQIGRPKVQHHVA
jgi:hypothetical protein